MPALTRLAVIPVTTTAICVTGVRVTPLSLKVAVTQSFLSMVAKLALLVLVMIVLPKKAALLASPQVASGAVRHSHVRRCTHGPVHYHQNAILLISVFGMSQNMLAILPLLEQYQLGLLLSL
jgi:hypothetical protein